MENTRNQALSNLQAEQQRNAATFNQQRNTANAQNRLSAKNFQEYLASTGRANSGLNAQARMQNANNLNTSLNSINSGESAALADINRRTTDANNAYNSGLASANAQIEADYIKNLLDQREKDLNRQLQEKQFNESVRQFNENLALQKAQLYGRFSGGSGGGGRSYRRYSGGSSNDNTGWTDTSSKQTLSKDAQKYGTFSNGYQPKGISGHGKLSKSGDTITYNGKKQNVWKTKDGTKWYWDGKSRTYKPIYNGGFR